MTEPSSPAETPARSLVPSRRADWMPLVGGAILVAGAVAVYSRTLHTPLVFDDACIADDPSIRHWSTAFSPSNSSGAAGRPILNLSLAFNYAISGTAVWSYHVLNCAIHALAGMTLFGIIRRTLAPRSGAAAPFIAFSAALLWTLHPLQTETVTSIIQRTEALMGLFYLLTLYFFIRGIGAEHSDANSTLAGSTLSEPESWAGWSRPHLPARGGPGVLPNVAHASESDSSKTGGGTSWVWFALCVATCLLGMATKEVMVSAPLMVLLYDRTFVAGSFRAAWQRRRALYAGLACTWILLAALMVGSQKRGGTVGFGLGVSSWEYALTQCRAIVLYLKLSVWPHPLVIDYGTALATNALEVWPQALLLILLAAGTIFSLWRRPALGFAGAWFFAILAPSSSVVPLVTQTIAEHRMYLPLAAVIVTGVAGLHALLHRLHDCGQLDHGTPTNADGDQPATGRPARGPLVRLCSGLLSAVHGPVVSGPVVRGPVVLLVPLLALALGLGLLTARRNEDYRSELAICNDTVAKQPDNARAHTNLGVALSKIPGHQDDAIAQYEEALRLKPDSAEAHNNLGFTWAQIPGRLNDAVAQYEEALRLKPDFAEAHNNLGVAWAQVPGRHDDAIAQFEDALRLKPDYAEAHNDLGLALSQVPGRLNDAIAQFEEALRLKPDFAEAHNNLGLALSHPPGRMNEASAQFDEALRLKPDYAEAHFNLGNVWSQTPGRLNDAIAEYQDALRLKPDLAEAHHNLGVAWAQLPGRLNDAVAEYKEALRLKPDFAEAHMNLGLAWSRTPGRRNDAVAEYKEALRLRPDYAPAWHNLGTSCFYLGDLPAAAAAFREELRLSPDDPEARQALAAVLKRIGDH